MGGISCMCEVLGQLLIDKQWVGLSTWTADEGPAWGLGVLRAQDSGGVLGLLLELLATFGSPSVFKK